MTFAEVYPAFAEVTTGPHGTIWVQQMRIPERATAGDEIVYDVRQRGAPNWDIFDQEGRFLGVVQLPAGFRFVTFRDTALYGIARDSLGVSYIERLTLHRTPSPLTPDSSAASAGGRSPGDRTRDS
jgi:hypothetical protein